MKKRIVALMLVLVMLCTGVALTACSASNVPPETVAKKSAAEVINEAMAKTEALDEMAAVMKIEFNMAMEGMTLSIPITVDMKAKDMKSENVTMSMVMNMALLGQEIEMEMYQEGQWAYVVMGDMKYKSSVEAVGDELDYTDTVNDMLVEIPEELLNDLELVMEADGSQSLTISFSDEKFSEIYNDLIQAMNAEAGMEMGELKISDAVVKVTVADGYVTVCDISFTMEVTAEGVTTTMDAKASVTYENPGQPVTITPPEGYQDFEEIGMDYMLA